MRSDEQCVERLERSKSISKNSLSGKHENQEFELGSEKE